MVIPLGLVMLFPECGIAVRLLLPPLLGIAAVVAVFYGGDRRGRLAAKLGIRPVRCGKLGISFFFAFLLAAACGLLTAAFQALLEYLQVDFEAEQPLVELAAHSDFATWLLIAFAVCIAVPAAEELIFRRALYGWLLPLGVWSATVLTALVFSLCHMFLLGIPGLFLLGFGFQRLFCRFRNLVYPVFVHAVFNLITLCAMLVAPETGQGGGLI